MQRKTLIIILVVLIIIALIGGWWLFFGPGSTPSTVPGDSDNNTLFPFGDGSGVTAPTPVDRDDTGTTPLNTDSGNVPLLRQITTVPVAGAITLLDQDDEEVVRYIERGTGHIYDAPLNSLTTVRISNTTIPAIYEAFFVEDGEGIIARFLKEDNLTIQTFYGALVEPTETQRSSEILDEAPQFVLSGGFLSDGITDLAVSPDTNKIFYLLASPSGAFGTLANPDGSGKQTIFSSPLKDWLPSWGSNARIFLSSKPAASIEGIGNILRTSGVVTKELDNIPGLTGLLNRSSDRLLYAQSTNSNEIGLRLHIVGDTGDDRSIVLRTLPEKCVWSDAEREIAYCGAPRILPIGTYPDHWYQGVVSFDDALWKINTDTGRVTQLINPSLTFGKNIDVTRPFLNNTETHLFFINKKDGTLWSLELDSVQ